MRKILNWILVPIVSFLTKIIAKIKMPWSEKEINGKHYYGIRDYIKPFDVILSTTKGAGSNVVNFSELNHGELYVGDISLYNQKGVKGVCGAVAEGVREEDLPNHLFKKDRIVIIRPKFIQTDQNYSDLKRCYEKYVNAPYDYRFNKEGHKADKAFYCFEYVCRVFKDVFPKLWFKDFEIKALDIRYFTSKTFTDDDEKFIIIYDSDKHEESLKYLEATFRRSS